jgi:antitoxin component YwqK of YwqJK toxin-antitoxin module
MVSLGGLRAQDSTESVYRYADGAISSQGLLIDGVPSGYWVSFHPNGTRKSEGNWREGELDGEWVFYDEKGRLQTTLSYDQGKKEGEELKWDTLGVKLRSLPWQRDTLVGEQREFNAQGVEVARIPWRGGKKEGVALEFAMEQGQQGRIIRRMGYRDDLLRWVEDVNRLDDQGRKTGKWMTFWPNGRVRREGPFERGLEEGVFKYFSRNGDLERTETYKRGEIVEDAPEAVVLDLRKTFHSNGEVSRVGPWRENDPMGTHRFFDEEGHLVEVKVFREGVLNASGTLDSLGRRTGQWTLYWNDGTPKAEGGYENGKREGSWRFLRLSGSVEQEGEYRQGEWHGRWRWYHLNGAVHRDEKYRKGRENGEFMELSSTGDTLARGEYERGYKQGPWMEHVNDDLREGNYLDGEADGVWQHTDSDGNLRFEGSFVAGIPTGQHVRYWPNGIRSSVGSYEGGLPDGNWRYFDVNGVVRLTRQYRAGVIFKVNGAKTDR